MHVYTHTLSLQCYVSHTQNTPKLYIHLNHFSELHNHMVFFFIWYIHLKQKRKGKKKTQNFNYFARLCPQTHFQIFTRYVNKQTNCWSSFLPIKKGARSDVKTYLNETRPPKKSYSAGRRNLDKGLSRRSPEEDLNAFILFLNPNAQGLESWQR